MVRGSHIGCILFGAILGAAGYHLYQAKKGASASR
jgi:hypothetical protein